MEDIELSVAGVAFRASIDGPAPPTTSRAASARTARPPARRDRARVRLVDGWRRRGSPVGPLPRRRRDARDDGSVYFLRETDALLWRPDAARGGRVGRLSTRPCGGRPCDAARHAAAAHPPRTSSPARRLLRARRGLRRPARRGGVHIAPPAGQDHHHAQAPARPRAPTTRSRPPRGRHVVAYAPLRRRVRAGHGPAAMPLRAIVLLEKAPSFASRASRLRRGVSPAFRCTVRFVWAATRRRCSRSPPTSPPPPLSGASPSPGRPCRRRPRGPARMRAALAFGPLRCALALDGSRSA